MRSVRIAAVVLAGFTISCESDKSDNSAPCTVGNVQECNLPGNVSPGASICLESGVSDCFELGDCNLLVQDCGEGLGCYEARPGVFCAPTALYPCDPGQLVYFDREDNPVCRAYCDYDAYPMATDPDHCEPEEFCTATDFVEFGVGVCTPGDDG